MFPHVGGDQAGTARGGKPGEQACLAAGPGAHIQPELVRAGHLGPG